MTPAVRAWVERVVEKEGLGVGRTLDLGSYNVNGCVRDLFDNYIGADIRPGPNVDLVLPPGSRLIPYRDGEFDTVLSLEMIEHDEQFWKSVREMNRVLKVGGAMLISTRGIGYGLHDEPHDYYRFTEHSIRWVLDYQGGVRVEEVIDDKEDRGVMGWGRKDTGYRTRR